MNDTQLDDVFDRLLDAKDTRGMQDTVSGLSDEDLQTAYNHFFDLYIEELAHLAEDDYAYGCQNCMKTPPDGASEFFQSAVSVISGEIENRKRFVAASKLPN